MDTDHRGCRRNYRNPRRNEGTRSRCEPDEDEDQNCQKKGAFHLMYVDCYLHIQETYKGARENNDCNQVDHPLDVRDHAEG